MATPQIKASVGANRRSSKGPSVKNNPADVELVRKMLRANGFGKVADGNKVDAQLLKAIGAHQKRQGFKSPDQVVDPDGKTFKSLVSKYIAATKKEPPQKPKEVINARLIIYRGKKYEILEKDYKPAVAYLFKKLKSVVYGRLKFCLSLAEIYGKAVERADAKQDFIMAVSHDWIGAESAMPRAKTYDKAINANNLLLAAYRSGDLQKLEMAFIESDKTVEQFEKEVAHYLKKLNSGAKTGLTVIKVSRAVSFAILAAAAAPSIVLASSTTLAQARAISSVAVTVIQSAGEELEKHAAGQDVNISSAIKNISIDGIIETLTQGLIKKVDSSMIDKYITKVLPGLSKVMKGISNEHLHPMVKRFASNTGEAMVQEALKQGLTLTGDSVKKGKHPKRKDYEKSMTELLYACLSSSFLKQMTDYEASYKANYGNTLRKKVIPETFNRHNMPGYKMPKALEKKMVNEVYQKVSDASLKLGYDQVVDVYTGKENGAKLNKKMQTRLAQDKAIVNMVEKEFFRLAEKYKVQVKK